MAVELIDTLIDKQDTFEIVRDRIAEILVAEVADQMVKAVAALKDPELWNIRVFTERSNPFEQLLNKEVTTPIVNIWYDNGSFPKDKSDTVERQMHNATFNIDCYGFGISSDNIAGGHNPGDKEAAFEVQRTVRLVRNILMASVNTYLQLRKIVWGRYPESITIFQPQQDDTAIPNVVGARIPLNVDFNEFSPQVTPQILEQVSIDIKRKLDGQIVAETDYTYP